MSRFDCPSGPLELKKLVEKTMEVFWVALAVALGMHLGITQVRFAQEDERVVKPLTTKFIKREPRLVKPLELKKRPKPRPRPMRRTLVMVKAKMSRREVAPSTATPLKILDSLAKPKSGVTREVSFESTHLESCFRSFAIEGNKEPEQKIDMSLEMMDIEALDTGKYHAMVVQDPRDKRNIKGFFHLALAYSLSLLGGKEILYANWDPRYTRHLTNLCDAMNRYTQIETDFQGIYTYDSSQILKVPWIYASAFTSFEITSTEAENLGRYLLNGGFFFADVIPCGVQYDPRNAIPMDRSLRRLYKRALGTQGLLYQRDWDFERLPDSHFIYHSFFDFNDGPPMAGDMWYGVDGLAPSPFNYLEGIIIEGKLVGILSNKFYQDAWGHQFLWVDKDPTRPLQFGINTIIFALTQEGSITHRVMDTVSH